MKELEEGIMRVIAGPEKKTRVMSEKERLITAYHELGHAIVGHLLPNCDPVHKISIISRGQALGYTISLPTEDKFLTTRAELTDTMAMTLGGRAAEEIVFGEITTGASNDLEKVTETAKQMVMRFGMSERLGPRVFGHDRGQPFLGREFSSEPDYSDEIAREIDDEIRRIVESAHQTAKGLLNEQPRGARPDLQAAAGAGDDRRRAVRRRCSTASRTTRSSPTRRSRPKPAEPAPEPERAAARGRPADPAAPARASPAATPARAACAAAQDTRYDPKLMGVVNVTPDSFSDGGLYLDPEAAIAHGEELAAARGGDPRCRRGIDSAGGRGGGAEEELRRVDAGGRGAGRGGRDGLGRHLEGGGRRGGARRRRDDRQRRHRAARRPGDGGAVRRARRRPWS